MSSWPAAPPDENRVRLRASCNACNESKVRCSQRKPTCTRCERNGTECIYGLSRRTHKDAPPISAPPSQRGARSSRPGRPPRSQQNGDTRNGSSTNSSSPSTITTHFNDPVVPDDLSEAHNHHTNFLSDYIFPMTNDTDPMHTTSQMLDFSSLITDSTSGTPMMPGQFSTAGAEYGNPTPWVPGSVFGTSHNSDSTDMKGYWALNEEGDCSCHAGVTELLGSMRPGGGRNDHGLSLDAQLAKLKQCITASETSMGCAHSRDDSEPIHILAVAMLIGYVIDDFKTLATESNTPRRSRSSSLSLSSAAELASLGNAELASLSNSEMSRGPMTNGVTSGSATPMPRGSMSGLASGVATPTSNNKMTNLASLDALLEPRLSWGVLELEEDDEMDLRQRLYLLSFRKLERLLSQLTLYVQDLHNADRSRPTPFVIACGYTRLWLKKKADDVKRLFSVPHRDESIDSALA